MKKRALLLTGFCYLLIICVLEAGASNVKEDERDEEKTMSVACAIINGKINNPSECNKIQKKLLEKRCKDEKDPNACKAIEVAKQGKDPEGENLVKIKSEDKGNPKAKSKDKKSSIKKETTKKEK